VKHALLGLAAAVSCIAAPCLAQTAPVPVTPPIKASKIILVGDSTTQVGSGWGGAFCAYHVVSSLACVNLARGGRSTLNYRVEGSWNLALAEMKTPGFVKTWVLIQFGHNDQPGKPGRSTDLATEFPANLKRYIAETRATGAIPVLLTPLTRRQFKDGKLDRDLDPWADAVRKVAAETNTPLVDLNKLSADAVQAMGPAASLRLAEIPAPAEVVEAAAKGTTIAAPKVDSPAAADTGGPNGHMTWVFDYTHIGREGADVFSAMVADALARAVPELRGALLP